MSKKDNSKLIEEKLAEIGLTTQEALDWLSAANKNKSYVKDEKFYIQDVSDTLCNKVPCCHQTPCAQIKQSVEEDIPQTSNLAIKLKQTADYTTVYVDGVQITNVTNLSLTYDGELGLPVAIIEIVNPEIL